ncbi:MAG: hypothetical protein R2860_10225 [Desulfobacterales bacterium]
MYLKTVADAKQYDPGVVFVLGNMVPDFFPGSKCSCFTDSTPENAVMKGGISGSGIFLIFTAPRD